MTVTTISGRGREDFPFAKYADDTYPLLKIAAAQQGNAHSYKVEWLVDAFEDGRFSQTVFENFTQIARTPFRPDPNTGDRELWRALDRHLQVVEDTLWFGVPTFDRSGAHPLGTCGGALHYLGREPLQADSFSLRVLQDCVLLYDREEVGRATTHEFLSEFSLQVFPAHSIRPYVGKRRLNAWAQGSSLVGPRA